MPLFMMTGKDGKGAAPLRKETRPAHLAHWQKVHDAGKLVFAGPLLDEVDGEAIGSQIIFEAEYYADALELANDDPYQIKGVFELLEVYPTKQVLP